MSRELPHLLLVNPRESSAENRTHPRKPPEQEENEVSAEGLLQQAARFSRNLVTFAEELRQRDDERDTTLGVPETLTSVDIEFQNWFDPSEFERVYYRDFGLVVNRYSEYNRCALFTVVDKEKFEYMLEQFRAFVNCTDHALPEYTGLIRFIKAFRFHSKTLINPRPRVSQGDPVYLSLVNFGIEPSGDARQSYDAIRTGLERFLRQENIEFQHNDYTDVYELKSVTDTHVDAIARNFDIVHTISSFSYGVIRESAFGVAVRDFPFSVNAPTEDLPIIGVIDTGVSSHTPLAPLIVATDYTVPGGDAAVDTHGHGTSVAAFAALGKKIIGAVRGRLDADARILPIKVLDGRQGHLSTLDVGNLIVRARYEHGVRIFVLTICYVQHLRTDEAHSDYANYLDQISREHDLLIFISTGNYDVLLDTCVYPRHFLAEETNMCSPAESMNNITVGATGANFEDEVPITQHEYPFTSSSLPAAYSRKFHLDEKKWKQKNRHLFKPDVVYPGGNYMRVLHRDLGPCLDNTGAAGLQYLSIVPGAFFGRDVGTSFSAPLVANLAAKMMRKYPQLRLQTIKALIVNSADPVRLDVHKDILSNHLQRSIGGNGLPNEVYCLSSNEDNATIIIEDKIKVGYTKEIPVELPRYLRDAHKNKSLIKVTATLCFAFRPVKGYPTAYCPVHVAFGMFRNVELEQGVVRAMKNGRTRYYATGINGGPSKNFVFSGNWSQDAYFKKQQYSNTQKVTFYVSRDWIEREENKFKLAVQCAFHKCLPDFVTATLPEEYDYSLVLRFQEKVPIAMQTHVLYDELQGCNNLQVLATSELQAEDDLEATIEQ
ncbi:S8 family peptidase [Hymenobacter gummosus]|uniref:S8 family peptidase n=1 Tax=Hymenobacter gummosus TaxID=1776032 RepID=A0A431U8B2_9BACT|nr:S8 family peptidase [Hymenobacter gummosus]RTQ53268.1 S8 family peptidase [Hymenobacter gummosus]